MRPFEIILILTNLLTLLFTFRKQPRGMILVAAGINAAFFIAHGLVEGFRYQMFFSYLFVILLILVALIRLLPRFAATHTPKAIKIPVVLLAALLVGLSAFLSYALPVFTLPAPSGPDPVGVSYFHLVDQQRTDPFLAASTQKRELMVKVYYPAKPDDSKPYARYFHNSPELIRLFTAFYQGFPAFAFDHLNLVTTHSKDDLILSDRQADYPVILFSHGAGNSMEVYTAQGEDLASHGYIVVAIDHPYVSAATQFPEHFVTAMQATTDFHAAEPAEIITWIMTDDARFVIDQLAGLNTGKIPSGLTGRLDLDNIGVIGHSVGGAVAYNLANTDPRVKATINLDGAVYIPPEADSSAVAPFLMLVNDRYHVQALEKGNPLMRGFEELPPEEQNLSLSLYGGLEAYQAAYTQARQVVLGLDELLRSSGNLYTIQGSDHMKFSDTGLFIGDPRLREWIGIGGETAPVDCLQITEAVTTAFFNRYLKGEGQDILPDLVKKYPKLRKVF